MLFGYGADWQAQAANLYVNAWVLLLVLYLLFIKSSKLSKADSHIQNAASGISVLLEDTDYVLLLSAVKWR